jgi:hypothetical protein
VSGYSIIFALNTSSIYTTLIKDLIIYIRIAVEYPIIKGWGGIPLTGLTLPHCVACAKPGAGFPTSYFVVLFIFNKLR